MTQEPWAPVPPVTTNPGGSKAIWSVWHQQLLFRSERILRQCVEQLVLSLQCRSRNAGGPGRISSAIPALSPAHSPHGFPPAPPRSSSTAAAHSGSTASRSRGRVSARPTGRQRPDSRRIVHRLGMVHRRPPARRAPAAPCTQMTRYLEQGRCLGQHLPRRLHGSSSR